MTRSPVRQMMSLRVYEESRDDAACTQSNRIDIRNSYHYWYFDSNPTCGGIKGQAESSFTGMERYRRQVRHLNTIGDPSEVWYTGEAMTKDSGQTGVRHALDQVADFACYYGTGRLAELAAYDLVIVQAAHYAAEDLSVLSSQGVNVLAYLSIGEVPDAEVDERWALVDPTTGDRACNEIWATTLVDCRSSAWRDFLIEERIPALLQEAGGGVFLDTVDAHDRYPFTRDGTIALLRTIRESFPDAEIVVNRGFSILDTVMSIANGIVFEAFSTHYTGTGYETWPDADLAWTSSVAQRLRQTAPIPVFTIDYAGPADRSLRRLAERRARAYGFIPFVSTYLLDWLPAAPSRTR